MHFRTVTTVFLLAITASIPEIVQAQNEGDQSKSFIESDIKTLIADSDQTVATNSALIQLEKLTAHAALTELVQDQGQRKELDTNVVPLTKFRIETSAREIAKKTTDVPLVPAFKTESDPSVKIEIPNTNDLSKKQDNESGIKRVIVTVTRDGIELAKIGGITPAVLIFNGR